MFYWRSAFGDSEFAIRSLSALLGVGSVIAIFFTSLRVYGKTHALWSSMILAVSSFSVFYSQDARPYALLIFIASLQIYFFSYSMAEDKSNKIIPQLLFGIFTAIGTFSSILTIIFSCALSLSHIIVYRNLKEWIKWWIPAVIFSSWMIWFYLSSPAASDPTATTVTRTGLPIVQNIILQHRDKSAKSVLLFGQPKLLQYYGDSSTLYAPEYVLKTVNGKNMAEKVSTMTKNSDRVFVIINREFNWKLKDVFKREMSDLYNLEDEADWPYMKIYRFTRNK